MPKGRPILCEIMRKDKGYTRHGTRAILLEVGKDGRALVKPQNHDYPIWVPLAEIRVKKARLGQR